MYNEMIREMESRNNNAELSVTENGAVGYSNTTSALVDMFYKTSSYRNKSDEEIVADFVKAYKENPDYALRYLFYVRDVRRGLGERRIFRVCMKAVVTNPYFDVAIDYWKLCQFIVEMGRWDDMFVFRGTKVFSVMVQFVKKQLAEDKINKERGMSYSFMAKWLPSINTSNAQQVNLAKELAKKMGMSDKEYRQLLTELRKGLPIVERMASANQWGAIDYNTVPSKANILYSEAFMRHDEDRRKTYLNALAEGKEGVVIHSSAAYPYEILNKAIHGGDSTVEEMWKALPDYVKGNGSTLVVADGSGSMEERVGNSSVTALVIANSLAMYFAERASGEFKDKYITFSEYPQFVDLSVGTSLSTKWNIARTHCEVANTNIEAVFDLVLKTAVNNNMKSEDIPANILILSDMEFDACARGNANARSYTVVPIESMQPLFKEIAERWKKAGYKLPKLIFWNLMSRTGTVPMLNNENGVLLVSGFSPTIMEMVLGSSYDTAQMLKEKLNEPTYAKVNKAIHQKRG